MAQRPASQWPFRWELLLRYRYIETTALWEGRLTTRHLCETFGIGRQQASKDINNYLREVGRATWNTTSTSRATSRQQRFSHK